MYSFRHAIYTRQSLYKWFDMAILIEPLAIHLFRRIRIRVRVEEGMTYTGECHSGRQDEGPCTNRDDEGRGCEDWGGSGGVYIRWMQGGRKTPFVCLAPGYFDRPQQAADH